MYRMAIFFVCLLDGWLVGLHENEEHYLHCKLFIPTIEIIEFFFLSTAATLPISAHSVGRPSSRNITNAAPTAFANINCNFYFFPSSCIVEWIIFPQSSLFSKNTAHTTTTTTTTTQIVYDEQKVVVEKLVVRTNWANPLIRFPVDGCEHTAAANCACSFDCANCASTGNCANSYRHTHLPCFLCHTAMNTKAHCMSPKWTQPLVGVCIESNEMSNAKQKKRFACHRRQWYSIE